MMEIKKTTGLSGTLPHERTNPRKKKNHKNPIDKAKTQLWRSGRKKEKEIFKQQILDPEPPRSPRLASTP